MGEGKGMDERNDAVKRMLIFTINFGNLVARINKENVYNCNYY